MTTTAAGATMSPTTRMDGPESQSTDLSAVVNVEDAMLERIRQDRGNHVTDWPEPHAYASEAGHCARQVAFRVAGVQRTNPIEAKGERTGWLGTMIHDLIQRGMLAAHEGAEFEVPARAQAHPISCRADAVVGDTLYEFKSKSGYFFSRVMGDTAEWDDSIQAHVTAAILDKPKVRIGYVNREDLAYREFEDELDREAAQKEMTRLALIVEWAMAGRLPPRRYHGRDIEKPGEKTGHPDDWVCNYCGWLDACKTLPTGPTTIAALTPSGEELPF